MSRTARAALLAGTESLPEVLGNRLSEREWQAQVVAMARQMGWFVYHPWTSIKSESGWPDLVLLRPPHALFWELKGQKGKVTPQQERVLGLLKACGLKVDVLRPSDRLAVHWMLVHGQSAQGKER